MIRIWEEKFRLRTYDVDAGNRIKMSSLFLLLQEVASNHADHLKFGYDDLMEKDLLWVLSKMKIELVEYPSWKDEIIIRTWARAVDGFFAFRDFQILNSRNIIIGAAMSAWLILDLRSGRPQKPDSFFDFNPFSNPEKAINSDFHVFKIPNELNRVHDLTVRYSDIDINRHVNNAHYIEWITDCIGEELSKNLLKSIEVHFQKESRYGSNLELFAYNNDDGSKLILCRTGKGGNDVFRSLIQFQY